MKAHDVLQQVAEQHTHLRTLLAEARAYAEQCSRGAGQWNTLKGWLAAVVDAVRAHNRDEERLVGAVLPSLDGWGERGAAFMSDEHVREHANLHDAMLRASEDEDPARAGGVLLGLIDRVRGHMDAEERLFLRPDVLHDRGD